MDFYIVSDVGGTQIRVSVFPVDQIKPVRQQKIATRGEGSAVERLVGLMKSLWPEEGQVRSITVGAPGALDPEAGVVFAAPNISGWTNLPLKSMLAQEFNLPIYLGNDANLAALGEWRFGAGRGHHNLIYMTISTGIGGGVILHDHLLTGAHGLATELGHVEVCPDGAICGCGKRGHLEAYASGTAIARYIGEQLAAGRSSSLATIKHPTSKDVSSAAAQGDALALETLQRAGQSLGKAIAGYLHIFNPSIVILGGGVTRSGDPFWIPLRQAVKDTVFSPQYLEDLTITTAELGDDVGLLGALVLAQTEDKTR